MILATAACLEPEMDLAGSCGPGNHYMANPCCEACGVNVEVEKAWYRHQLEAKERERKPEQGLILILDWVPTDDTEITCYLCCKTGVTHEYTHRQDDSWGGRRTVTIGIHEKCVIGDTYILKVKP